MCFMMYFSGTDIESKTSEKPHCQKISPSRAIPPLGFGNVVDANPQPKGLYKVFKQYQH